MSALGETAEKILALSREVEKILHETDGIATEVRAVQEAIRSLRARNRVVCKGLQEMHAKEDAAKAKIGSLAHELQTFRDRHCKPNTQDAAAAAAAAIADMAISDNSKELLEANITLIVMRKDHERHRSAVEAKTRALWEAGRACFKAHLAITAMNDRLAALKQDLAARTQRKVVLAKEWEGLQAQANAKATLMKEMSGAAGSLPEGFGEVPKGAKPWTGRGEEKKLKKEGLAKKMDPLSPETTWETAFGWYFDHVARPRIRRAGRRGEMGGGGALAGSSRPRRSTAAPAEVEEMEEGEVVEEEEYEGKGKGKGKA